MCSIEMEALDMAEWLLKRGKDVDQSILMCVEKIMGGVMKCPELSWRQANFSMFVHYRLGLKNPRTAWEFRVCAIFSVVEEARKMDIEEFEKRFVTEEDYAVNAPKPKQITSDLETGHSPQTPCVTTPRGSTYRLRSRNCCSLPFKAAEGTLTEARCWVGPGITGMRLTSNYTQ
ncbi:hypothetical protein DFP72DRAFT_853138 [Ephemerocybe angulata]|uniref:Uncharacterized protein n=1 Tax=Ephemerocybe angulata TaxID=980116 RepID=A0A8H6HKL2_9AGAR|nr:hypothetical protein DFP72DRAFT_853138 [Tulosesus angulatus]